MLERFSYTIEEVAARFGLSSYMIRGAIERGDIPGFRIGPRTLVLATALPDIERLALEQVSRAKAKQEVADDEINKFVDDHCVIGDEYVALFGDLYMVYVEWCGSQQKEPLFRISFASRLTRLGFEPGRGAKGVRTREGLRLRLPEEK